MKPHTPHVELSRPIEVARVSKLGSHEKLIADGKECLSLAKRFDVPAVHAMSAVLHIKPWRGGGFKVTGEATVDLDQVSVVSLEQFRSVIVIVITRYFVAKLDETSEEDLDVIENGVIDIGEVVAEEVALELEPYPRKPGESFEDRIEDDEKPVAKISPFAKLKPKT